MWWYILFFSGELMFAVGFAFYPWHDWTCFVRAFVCVATPNVNSPSGRVFCAHVAAVCKASIDWLRSCLRESPIIPIPFVIIVYYPLPLSVLLFSVVVITLIIGTAMDTILILLVWLTIHIIITTYNFLFM